MIAAHAANATLYAGKLPFDAVKSFAPVSLVGIAPLIMTANNDLPVKDIKELIAYAKANPGSFPSVPPRGRGGAPHHGTFQSDRGRPHGPRSIQRYRARPAGPDGGNIQILVDVPSTLMPQVRAGKIKALGMFSSKRVAGAAEVPTIAEAGGPLIEGSTWVLVLAPAGTPHEIVGRLPPKPQRQSRRQTSRTVSRP